MENNLIYHKTVYIDSAHADRFQILRPACLLESMQEAAGEHAFYLGFGRDRLIQQGMFWAIVRQTIEINRLPGVGETMILETWPGPATRTAFPRHMVGRTPEGEELFRANTLWLFMNMETRAMVLPSACGLQVPGITLGGELPNPTGIIAKNLTQTETRRVRYSDLDCNGHMSNTKYLNWLVDLLPASYHETHRLKKLHICYLNEAREDQDIHLAWAQENGTLTLEGRRQDGESATRVFAVKAELSVIS